MSDELTPREHDDMRDLLLAGTQRIRPAVSRRAWLSAAVAIVLVAGAVGGVVATAVNIAPRGDARVASDPTATPPPAEPDPHPVMPDPGHVARDPNSTQIDPGEVMPTTTTVEPPAPGAHLRLQPVPIYDDRLILGTASSLEAQGIDVPSAQGFQSVGSIHPWIANQKDGTGRCLLIRQDYDGGGWSEIVCDAGGVPASVEREVDGRTLLFTIVDGAVDVYTRRG